MAFNAQHWNGRKMVLYVVECLSEIKFGVLIVTKSNFNAPWLMFEAGALAKTLDATLTPVLCNVEALDVASTPPCEFSVGESHSRSFLPIGLRYKQGMQQAARRGGVEGQL